MVWALSREPPLSRLGGDARGAEGVIADRRGNAGVPSVLGKRQFRSCNPPAGLGGAPAVAPSRSNGTARGRRFPKYPLYRAEFRASIASRRVANPVRLGRGRLAGPLRSL